MQGVKAPKNKKAKAKQAPAAKGSTGKKKKVLKFHIECRHPVEDGIMVATDFVSQQIWPVKRDPVWRFLQKSNGPKFCFHFFILKFNYCYSGRADKAFKYDHY